MDSVPFEFEESSRFPGPRVETQGRACPVERPTIDEMVAALRSPGRMDSVDGVRRPTDMADALLEMLLCADGTQSFLAEVARAAVTAIRWR